MRLLQDSQYFLPQTHVQIYPKDKRTLLGGELREAIFEICILLVLRRDQSAESLCLPKMSMTGIIVETL